MAILQKTLPQVTAGSPNTPVRVSQSHLLVSSYTIQSDETNTGSQYVGDASVSASNGQKFGPGDTVEWDAPMGHRGPEELDLYDVFVVSSTANSVFRISACIRK
jgi:hypothetical protein